MNILSTYFQLFLLSQSKSLEYILLYLVNDTAHKLMVTTVQIVEFFLETNWELLKECH